MSTIYALLAGIDKYRPPVPALDGCVNDMRAVRDYLVKRARETNTPLHLEVLENDQATRLNIVQKFEQHLARATRDDLAFFYYSGHGSQEHAHEVFWPIESDRKNETLVCFDSRTSDGMDLADKELATLIDIVAEKGAQVVVITDCCNSGGNTREVGMGKNRSLREVPPRTRSLDTYILPRKLHGERGTLSESGAEQSIVPNPRHIHLAAAHSHQLAKETWLGGSPRGVFTFSLLEVLEKAVGPLTYKDLARRVQNLVSKRTFEQHPQIHAPQIEDLDLEFLGGTLSKRANYFSLTYDRDAGWTLDAGAVHGIPDPGLGQAAVFSVYAEDATADELADLGMALGKVSVQQVFPERSTVRIEGGLWLDTQTAYRARVFSMPLSPVKVCIRGGGEGVRLALAALAADREAAIYLQRVDKPADCDYNLIAAVQPSPQYLITRKADADDQPLVEQVLGFSEAGARQSIGNLVHIARWAHILDLDNPGSNLFSEAVRVEIYPPTGNQPLLPDGDGIAFRYRATGSNDALPRFRVKVVNTSAQRLYVSLLHLSSQYAIDPGLIPNQGLWLEPGQEQWVRDGKTLRGQVADAIYATGRTEVSEVLKVIFATQDFNADLLRQPELGKPRMSTRGTDGPMNTRSLMFDDDTTAATNDWNASQVTVRLIREG